MPVYEFSSSTIRRLDETTFAKQGFLERRDVQRLLRDDIGVISPDTLVIAEEFSRWEDSRRRIDLLGLDCDANLVVIELKRDEEGGHIELQALRYAAMVSTMTFEEAVDTYSIYLRSREMANGSEGDARQQLLDFLSWEDSTEQVFNPTVRIILVAADFSKEVTSTVIWLTEKYGLDIRCVRIKPYRLADQRLIVDVQQIIPLPEAADYQVQIQKKAQQDRVTRANTKEVAERDTIRYEFWKALLERAREKTELHARRSPQPYRDLDAGSGQPDISWRYTIRQHDADVLLFINRDRDESKAIFDRLYQAKDTIESAFGEELEWRRLDDKNRCYIGKTLTAGGYRDEEQWPAIQQAMIDTMIRLERAFRQHLRGLSG